MRHPKNEIEKFLINRGFLNFKNMPIICLLKTNTAIIVDNDNSKTNIRTFWTP